MEIDTDFYWVLPYSKMWFPSALGNNYPHTYESDIEYTKYGKGASGKLHSLFSTMLHFFKKIMNVHYKYEAPAWKLVLAPSKRGPFHLILNGMSGMQQKEQSGGR